MGVPSKGTVNLLPKLPRLKSGGLAVLVLLEVQVEGLHADPLYLGLRAGLRASGLGFKASGSRA